MNDKDKSPEEIESQDIWNRLAADLQEPVSLKDRPGIWGQVSVLPDGLWGEARDETILIGREKEGADNLWQEASHETVILDRKTAQSLWAAAQDQVDDTVLLGRERANVWEELEDETLMLSRPGEGGWKMPRIRNASRHKPVRALGWALKKLETAKGEPYWVLKNLRKDTYLRLNEQQVYLWNLMDGSHSVQDLAVSNFIKYQIFSVEWLYRFLDHLYTNGFLVSEGVDVYQSMDQRLTRRGLGYWVKKLGLLLVQSEASLKGIDAFYGGMYKVIGWLIYSRPIIALLWLVSIAGLPAFFYISSQADLTTNQATGASWGIGLAGFILAETITLFVHESAHALTTKHYGRKVRRGGVGLYLGMIVFFMDTTDIWMEPRKPRLAVTWAGPFSGFFLGSVASLILLLVPGASLAGWTFQFASLCYVVSALNLNPLLKWDGYYILMDWLEIPMLHERSIAFVRKDLWSKLAKREKFTQEERIFAVFGVLALTWIVIFVYLMIELYGSKLLDLIQGIF